MTGVQTCALPIYAVEACRLVEGERTVTVASRMTPGVVYVRIQNPAAGRANIRGDRVETTKADKSRHGFGTQSMKKAAAKYGSDNLCFSQKDGMFIVDMELQFNDRKSPSAD